MKLKTRLGVARLELALATFILAGAVWLDLVRPHAAKTPAGVLIGGLLPVLLLAPMCVTSWRRLKKTRVQLAELGPEAEPSADLWTAPGAPGVFGMMLIVTAVAAALAPALLLHP